MVTELPAPIARYFETDRRQEPDAVAQCFTGAATVRDEGKIYVGRESIRRWKEESSGKYSYTVSPSSIAEESGRTVVTAHLTGDFPGSPVDLRYAFLLDDGKIAQLEILP